MQQVNEIVMDVICLKISQFILRGEYMATVLMECFSRSGGTLLNKIIGSLPNVVMLSEVNPLGGGWGARREKSYTTPKEQALNWYGIELRADDYVESILELNDICDKDNKTLVVRDWPYV